MPELTILIRPLSSTDSITELTELLHAAYADLAQQGFNYTAAAQTEADTRERIGKKCCLVATINSKLVGTIIYQSPDFSKGQDWYHKVNVASFQQFAVLPRFQCTGIGSRLLEKVEEMANGEKAAEVAFNTSEGAHGLIRWYERKGYNAVSICQWPGKVYRSVVMSKIF